MIREIFCKMPLCPSCSRSMVHARTICRSLGVDSDVFECRICKVCLTEGRRPTREPAVGSTRHEAEGTL
jgi:hypothetical protein